MDIEMSEGQPETAPAVVPQTIVNYALTNGVAEPTQSGVEGGGLEVPIISAAPPALNPDLNPESTTQTTPTVPRPIPKVYDVDVDKMQFKLYDKENGYLTPSDVLNDLGRIVHNTRIEPCNMEHVFKAHQMYSDFEAIIWEPQFLQDCERMAVRVRARRAAAKAEKATLEGVPSGGANDPTQVNGHSPATGDGDASPTERHLKRQRDDPSPSPKSGAEPLEGSLSKRAKFGENTMELSTSVVSTNPAPTAVQHTFLPTTQPSDYPSQAAQRPTSPILPDFTINQSLLANLSDNLGRGTAHLTIEQLEELRATCLDCIWRRRGDWDRSTMLSEMITSVSQYMLRPHVLKV